MIIQTSKPALIYHSYECLREGGRYILAMYKQKPQKFQSGHVDQRGRSRKNLPLIFRCMVFTERLSTYHGIGKVIVRGLQSNYQTKFNYHLEEKSICYSHINISIDGKWKMFCSSKLGTQLLAKIHCWLYVYFTHKSICWMIGK